MDEMRSRSASVAGTKIPEIPEIPGTMSTALIAMGFAYKIMG